MGSVLDLYQAIATILALDTPQALDSHNLSPVLLESKASPREELAFYRKGELRAYRKATSNCICSTNHKVVSR